MQLLHRRFIEIQLWIPASEVMLFHGLGYIDPIYCILLVMITDPTAFSIKKRTHILPVGAL